MISFLLRADEEIRLFSHQSYKPLTSRLYVNVLYRVFVSLILRRLFSWLVR